MEKGTNYNIVELIFDDFYEQGTRPEGRIFTFSRRTTDEPIMPLWKTAHWEEIVRLLTDKYYLSEKAGRNCGLITAARDYFGNRENIITLYEFTRDFGCSLPELSFVVKENGLGRIFIPNLSISNAKEDKFVQHTELESFIVSDSYNLLGLISQSAAANPDFRLH